MAVDLFEMTKQWSDFGFRNHLTKTALSVASNIAEGSERGSVKDFVRFLYMSKGSAGELRTQLYIAGRAGYVEKEALPKLLDRCRKVSSMIQKLINHLNSRNNPG